MKSKAVVFASTLALLITAPTTFAGEASPNNPREEMATSAPAAPVREEEVPAKKSRKAKKSKKAEAADTMPQENRVDPCLVDDLPGCK